MPAINIVDNAAELLRGRARHRELGPPCPWTCHHVRSCGGWMRQGLSLQAGRALSWKTLDDARNNQCNERGAVGRPVASRHDSITERIADRGDIPDDINVVRMPIMTSTLCTNLCCNESASSWSCTIRACIRNGNLHWSAIMAHSASNSSRCSGVTIPLTAAVTQPGTTVTTSHPSFSHSRLSKTVAIHGVLHLLGNAVAIPFPRCERSTKIKATHIIGRS